MIDPSMKIIFTLINSGDPDEMLLLGFHCVNTHSQVSSYRVTLSFMNIPVGT